MTDRVPQATGPEPTDVLDMAAKAVASMIPQITAPLSGLPDSPCDIDQVQTETDSTMIASSVANASPAIEEQAMQNKVSIEQQGVQVSVAQAVKKHQQEIEGSKEPTTKKESSGAIAEMPDIDESSEVSQQEVIQDQEPDIRKGATDNSKSEDAMPTNKNKPHDAVASDAGRDVDVEMVDYVEDVPAPRGPQDEMEMLDKYAFDFNPAAYDHRVPQRFTKAVTTIYVGKLQPQNSSLQEHREATEASEEIDTCPPRIPHENEMKVSGHGKAIECIWPQSQQVGNSQVDDPGEKIVKKAKKGTRIVDLSLDDMTITPYEPNALRVVAKKSNKVTKTWFLYALLSPDPVSNLCQGWKVAMDEVFYFRPFRGDEAKSSLPRKQVTMEKIRAVIFPDDSGLSIQDSQTKKSEHSDCLPAATGKAFKRRIKQSIAKQPSSKQSASKQALTKQPDSKQSTSKQQPASKTAVSKQLFSKAGGGRFQATANNTSHAMNSLTPSAEGDDGPTSDEDIMTGLEAEDFNGVDVNNAGRSGYDFMIQLMIQALNTAALKIDGDKSKSVSFKDTDGQVSDNLGNAINNSVTSRQVGDYMETEAKSPGSRPDVYHVTFQITELIMETARKQDLSTLHQMFTILRYMDQRCNPPKASALGLYLNVPVGDDADPEVCGVKLQELLGLFPELKGIKMDKHMLAWMIRGLQLTGQSIDIELLPPCLISFSALFRDKFKGKPSHEVRFRATAITDMICQARNDAEKMVELELEDSQKKSAPRKYSSHPYTDEAEKIWKGFGWSDPRQDSAMQDIDEEDEEEL